jgi:UDP-N-acetylmuramyl tripeptide synthase
VLIDYAHNPGGLAQLLGVARALQPRRLGLLLGQAGNRDDAAIAELACTAAACSPDRVLIKELPGLLRGRAPGEVTALIERSLRAAGLAPERIGCHADEEGAALALMAWAEAGDVVVLPVHTRAVRQRLAAVLA